MEGKLTPLPFDCPWVKLVEGVMKHSVFVGEPRQKPRRRHVQAYRDGVKRWLDVGLVLAAAPFWIPLVGALWILVRHGGAPGFFGHQRVGADGQSFKCWKLRTMIPNAEVALLAYLAENPDAAVEWSQKHKLRDDPRVTGLGRFLRTTSLDELPQLWNVLRGEMSLVGPRPVTRAEIAAYRGFEWAYFTLRPGITGLWQISARNETTYAERVRSDTQYLLGACLRLDLAILLRTFGVVWRKTGW